MKNHFAFSKIQATYSGCPGTECGLQARYILPALAECLGGTGADWRAASWTILSSVTRQENARAYWRELWGAARRERRALAGN